LKILSELQTNRLRNHGFVIHCEITDESLAVGQVALTAAVPEPETYALMLAGLAVVGAAARRRKAK
jgi:hypothetical protein